MVSFDLIRGAREPEGNNARGRVMGVVVVMCSVTMAVSSCNTPAGVQPSGVPKMVAPEEALIFPPAGGPEILTVVSRTYSNAVQQDVILRSDAATPGQNYMKVQLFGPQKAEVTSRDGLSSSSLRVSSIAREMRSAFPGVAMATSAEYLQNSYGAFSYASGKGRGDDSCIYGWQQIQSAESMRQGFKNLGRINVTLRLCQSGVTVRDLLAVMYNYTITGSYKSENWNPYGTALPPADGMGRSGNPIFPVAGQPPMSPGAQATIRPASAASVRPRAEPAMVRPQTASMPVTSTVVPSMVIPAPQVPAGEQRSTVAQPDARREMKQVSIPSPRCVAAGSATAECN